MVTMPINNNVVIPSTSKTYENGYLPSIAMLRLSAVETACLVERTSHRAWTALFAQANRDMPALRIKDVGDYRSFQGQLDLFVDRYIPVSSTVYNNTSSLHRKVWPQAPQYGYNSIYWIKNYAKFGGWPATAAVPGTSNHGRALALDIAEEYDSDTAPDGIRTQFYEWLCYNAPSHGIYASLLSEKWHWQYITGDYIPARVLAYEASLNPTPPPPPPDPTPPKDVDMIPYESALVAYDSRAQYQEEVESVRRDINQAVPLGVMWPGQYREIYVGYCNQAYVQVVYIAYNGGGYARLSAAGVGTNVACVGADGADVVEYGPTVHMRTTGGRVRVAAGPGAFDFLVNVYGTDTGQ